MARYAIAKLYKQEIQTNVSEENGDDKVNESRDSFSEDKLRGKIAGLEPVNFITSATPNLGSRGHKQVHAFSILNSSSCFRNFFLYIIVTPACD